MIVTPPTYVKRDGIQYRVDGVSGNYVFLWSQHNKGFVLDVSLGTLVAKNYHPVTLAMATLSPKSVIEGILGPGTCETPWDYHTAFWTSDKLKILKGYSTNLSKLLVVDCPDSVLPLRCIPIVEAMLMRVPAKELHQGIKSLYSIDIPKVTVNYLSGGYMMSLTLEELLTKARDQGHFHLDVVEVDRERV